MTSKKEWQHAETLFYCDNPNLSFMVEEGTYLQTRLDCLVSDYNVSFDYYQNLKQNIIQTMEQSFNSDALIYEIWIYYKLSTAHALRERVDQVRISRYLREAVSIYRNSKLVDKDVYDSHLYPLLIEQVSGSLHNSFKQNSDFQKVKS